ncbi:MULTISPECIES: amidase [unclassified Rhizobium]|uniref:amidase n=1 Tax=unclassified Rhizobium TaxID=2613769 RepID=UPI00288BD1BB|nr:MULTISPECIES: amidase [unclassified Rhizobium]
MMPQQSKSPALVTALALGHANGPTVAVKDCLDIAGLPTGCGSAAFANAQPARENAAVVDHLLASGCRIVGKANMHELAYGMTGFNAHLGTPVNPKWPDLIPGGSSSGCAVAVAEELVDFAVGTDTGGSVRQPAICCGVFGFKPTFGRISRRGASPEQSSLDCIGPLARDASMIEKAMQAIDPSFEAICLEKAPRLARLRTNFDQPVMEALAVPFIAHDFAPDYIDLPSLDDAFKAGMVLIARETYLAFGHLLERPDGLGEDIRARLTAAAGVSDADVAWAEGVRERFTVEVDAVFSSYDIILTPALPCVPPTLQAARDPSQILSITRYLRPFNLSGHPALVVPALTSLGLPVGYQLIGPKGRDEYVCAVGRWFADMM